MVAQVLEEIPQGLKDHPEVDIQVYLQEAHH
jgi:hypothetical protein